MNATLVTRILIFIISIITLITVMAVYFTSDNIIAKKRHGVVISKDILHGGGKSSSSYPTLAIKLDSGQVYAPYVSYASYASFNVGDRIVIPASDHDLGIYSSTTTILGIFILISVVCSIIMFFWVLFSPW